MELIESKRVPSQNSTIVIESVLTVTPSYGSGDSLFARRLRVRLYRTDTRELMMEGFVLRPEAVLCEGRVMIRMVDSVPVIEVQGAVSTCLGSVDDPVVDNYEDNIL
jgi:hypothetical protein